MWVERQDMCSPAHIYMWRAHARTHTRTHPRARACKHTHAHTRMKARTHARTHTHACARTHTRHTCKLEDTQVHTQREVCNTHMVPYIHTYTHRSMWRTSRITQHVLSTHVHVMQAHTHARTHARTRTHADYAHSLHPPRGPPLP